MGGLADEGGDSRTELKDAHESDSGKAQGRQAEQEERTAWVVRVGLRLGDRNRMTSSRLSCVS